MSNQGYDEELRAERAYIEKLYARLDRERAQAGARYRAALGETGIALVERDADVRIRARETVRLNVADNGLCFGRLDALSGERGYVGRIGLFDDEDDYEPLLLDWRAPAARPFYTATAATPENMRRRRQFHTMGRRVIDFTDEVLGRPGDDERGDAALLAAVNAPRGEGMRDIVATIQAEQDEIIRLGHAGVLVVEGGPGTGKTAVALHRVAYLLYTQRERMSRSGVLVVGPSPLFLEHIGRVLPSLGESDVVFLTPGGLVPGLRVTAEDTPEVAQLKGSLKILDVLAAAVADRQKVPEEPVPVELADVTVALDAGIAGEARLEARRSGLPHNEARPVFREHVMTIIAERAVAMIGEGWLTPEDRGAWADLRADVLEELAEHEELAAALDGLWPELTPETLLAPLYMSPRRLEAAGADPALFRVDGAAWTVSDVPLLDELAGLLGRDDSAERATARRRAAEDAEYAAGVMDVMKLDREEMDEDIMLAAENLIYAEDLAGRFAERDTRDLADRAAADRDWTYGHVVVDEAQELSEMDWRVLMRRCPSRSFTIVGDLAQRRSAAGARSWGSVLAPYVADRWVYRELTVNYRTPAEIMLVAGALLARFAPDARRPESVRACGVRPWSRRVADGELQDAIAEFVRDEAGREGTSAVIGPADVPGAIPPSAAKGLEFDAVLVVAPERILAEGPRGAAELYVALTRATQRLGVLHREPLPPELSGLAEAGVPVRAGHRRFL
ncbi:RNA polymerase recycling motor ATPase HelR [Amycolatopsis nalaikhensis]|uniref:RNA polymerase recycling motor ATPase HelR n=1 Tax=Amycolatopsis nalaikhensis TaxID=715472 RepID=A0ABY8XX10_9PSEU|nr:RNA polymerase recycling motor ATPase HelR [Amycolatopsis sp. 2-2]WIV59967.1 RNA polymerase recycling motor ATPase HelR [Amycolatopsis sp. 2-2]